MKKEKRGKEKERERGKMGGGEEGTRDEKTGGKTESYI